MKRILALFLAVLLLMPSFTLSASALSTEKFTYKVRIQTRDESNAGTNSSIYAGFTTYNDGARRLHCDNDGDDFERDTIGTYRLKLDIYPWMINGTHLHHGGGGVAPDWKPGKFWVTLPTMTDMNTPSIDIGYTTYSGTMEKGDNWNRDIPGTNISSTKRNFTSLGSFDGWGRSIYLNSSSSGALNLTWDGNATDQYGTYCILDHDDRGTLTFTNSFNTGSTSLFTGNFIAPNSTTTGEMYLTYSSIYNEMVSKGIGKATLKFTLSLPSRSSNAGTLFEVADSSTLSHTETVTIYRSCFDLGKVSYSDTPVFTARKDNDYLNREMREVTIVVTPTALHCVTPTTSEAKTIVSNFSCTPTLCLGNNTTNVVANLTYGPSADGTKLVFKGTVPADITSNGAGLNLCLSNVSTKYNSKVYELASGKSSWNYYISTLKVDTVAPTITITDKDSVGIDISNTLAASHTFHVSGSEQLYKSSSEPHPENDEAYLNYSLLYNGTKTSITNYDGKSGSYLNVTVPVTTAVMPDFPITLATAVASEGNYTLSFEAYDDAGNKLSNGDIENVLIDNVAPRYTLAESREYQDAQKTKLVEYNFTLDDICNTYKDTLASWARLYYVFVPEGESLPEFDFESVTGEIDTTIGRWNFVEAESDGTLPTILISLGLKESFIGDLYVFTKDSVGNETGCIKYVSDMKVYNYDTADTIITESNASAKNDFDISFTETVAGIDGIYKTEYRWIPESINAAPIEQSYIEYNGQDVGAGTQYGDDGEPVVLNGTYKLQYKVTEIRSNNYAVFEKNYIFDNLAPEISIKWDTANATPLQLQQATITINDVSGVKEASYKVLDADGKSVMEGSLTPTVSGDGKVGVRESVKLQPSLNGIYTIEVYSEDVNGYSSEHNTSESFAIRCVKPVVTSAGDDIEVKVEGISVTPSQEYTINLQVSENMLSAENLTQKQYLKYSVSTDGINYGAWNVYPYEMTADGDLLSINAQIESPVILSEGVNTVYFKVACAESGNTDTPPVSLISNVYSYTLIYDTTAPTYNLDYDKSTPTRDNVIITLTVNDANTVTGVDLSNSLITVTKVNDSKYMLSVSRNVTTTATLYDAVGNEVKVPVSVTCIDKDAPKVKITTSTLESGERTDATVKVTVTDANVTATSFGLVLNPDANSTIDAGAVDLFNSNAYMFDISEEFSDGVAEYTLILRGLDGDYGFGVITTDILSNETVTAPSKAEFTVVDAEPEITNTTSTPEITKSNATVVNELNVPVFILDSRLATGETDGDNMSIALAQTGKTYVSEFTRLVSDNSEQKAYVVDEANRAYTLTFASDSTFIDGFNLDYKLVKNGKEIDNNSFISFEEDDTVELIIVSNVAYEEQTFDITNMTMKGYEFNDEDSEMLEDGSYVKLVFKALHDATTEKSVSFVSYTGEGIEEERYQDENVVTAVFDETAPAITFTPSVKNDKPTNSNVIVDVVFSDSETGIATVERTVNGETETFSSMTFDSISFDENGTVSYFVTNNAGISYEAEYSVTNIDKTPIEEGVHYTVSYFYENYKGVWKPVVEGKYYRAVKAVVNFTNSDKELSIANNGGLLEKVLTADNQSFIFEIRDAAGNTVSRDVSWHNYDNDGGKIEWVLASYDKTNKPVKAFVTVSDKDSVNEIVYVEIRNSDGDVLEWNDEVIGNEYSVYLPLSGNYLVTAFDEAGNSFSEQVTVSNIDIVAPVITRLSYSTPEGSLTTGSVLVKIEEFSKSNVTVTGISLSDALGEYDIVYTPGSKEFRFKKNGYISVFFVDDYGNEAASVISVTSIYDKPPTLEAVATLAEDELSVDISFVQQLDEDGMPLDIKRSLEDLFVVYDGITYTTDSSFKVKTNGDYTFTVFDVAGNAQTIKLTVSDIDDRKPVIQSVSWSYEYLEEDENGAWVLNTYEKTLEIGKDTSGTEAGYVVGADINKLTNKDVTVTLVTDRDTSILGLKDIKSKYNSLIYAENGLFTFNLAAVNGTVSSYGVEIAVIDKVAPTLEISGASELIFIEGMTNGRDPEFAYDKSKFYDYIAYDVFDVVRVDLTDNVEIDFGDFNPDDINANVFDRSKPYTITYTVYDAAGNKTQIRRTVRLIGFYDTIALINGKMPNSANSISVKGDKFEISLKNFGGSSWARYAKGIYTMGQMKTHGTPISAYNGKYSVENLESGWYTVFVQTDKRDYFTITVYIDSAE